MKYIFDKSMFTFDETTKIYTLAVKKHFDKMNSLHLKNFHFQTSSEDHSTFNSILVHSNLLDFVKNNTKFITKHDSSGKKPTNILCLLSETYFWKISTIPTGNI